jgi:FkbM family methyltransferase
MKNLVKKVLKAIGLLEMVKDIFSPKSEKVFQKKYGSINQWILNRRGINVIYSTSDSYSKKWFFPRYDNDKIHEPVATDLFIDNIESNSVVFDIGGHLGYFSCLSSKLAPDGNVHVFEIDPKCYNLIEKNLKLNNISNVKINNYAVSDHNGFEKIPLLENPNAGLKMNSNAKDYVDVKAIQIDDYVSENNVVPNFIKIDVEGAELKVLNGMKKVLKQNNLKLLVEIHVDNLRKFFDSDYKDILRMIENEGFVMKNIESHRNSESGFTLITKDSDLTGNTMIFCEKSGL